MKIFKKFFVKNRAEAVSLISLFAVFVFLYDFAGKYMGNLIVDCGREAYFPLEMLKGKLLYRDILNIFGPFSYQINAVFYSIFGVKLEALRLAGGISAFLIVFSVYFISRFFTDKSISFAICFFVMSACVFSPWVFNYIFPYSYAMLYAYCAFLLSFLCLLSYLKKQKNSLLISSCFFAGISVASKYEYVLYALLLLVFSLYEFRKDLKKIFFCLFCFFIIPFLNYGTLFVQGLKLSEFFLAAGAVKKFAAAPSLNYFYKNTVGLYPSLGSLGFVLRHFLSFGGLFAGFVTSFYLLFITVSFFKRIVFLTIFAVFFMGLFSYTINHFSLVFCWLPIFVGLMLCFFVFAKEETKKAVFFFEKRKLLSVFLFVVVLSSLKTLFCLRLWAYGTFTFPLLFVAFTIFVTEYLPSRFKSIDGKILKGVFVFAIFSLSFVFLEFSAAVFKSEIPVNTDMGVVYGGKAIAETILAAVEYIKNNSENNDKIWVIPEGIMINFLSKRASVDTYYAFYPPYIETFGEDKILHDIKNNPPRFILINSRDTSDYGKSYLCADYGFEVCSYVKKSYSKVKTFGGKFFIEVYERKLSHLNLISP